MTWCPVYLVTHYPGVQEIRKQGVCKCVDFLPLLSFKGFEKTIIRVTEGVGFYLPGIFLIPEWTGSYCTNFSTDLNSSRQMSLSYW